MWPICLNSSNKKIHSDYIKRPWPERYHKPSCTKEYISHGVQTCSLASIILVNVIFLSIKSFIKRTAQAVQVLYCIHEASLHLIKYYDTEEKENTHESETIAQGKP